MSIFRITLAAASFALAVSGSTSANSVTLEVREFHGGSGHNTDCGYLSCPSLSRIVCRRSPCGPQPSDWEYQRQIQTLQSQLRDMKATVEKLCATAITFEHRQECSSLNWGLFR